ncbi:hypothetical protein A2856_04165 [Candidatus Uhrbacteria bacterium RIFCSPHIGHO2_01_FULL_63_20]|uniref:histidine kinase n=1 Tax=Candidatus Uhrbacteria bacterium RIFCSPHIGHO2_01_FULL_63_20 TaxID=1802385 RepID=A0A1F7TMM1_9BACT|nr:MAG: hypothetical protein A2856_04165 [Candidatus Uhrbacteria bacterium RIFCSPHIGHO2_01_FULL_63_20]
MDKKRHSRLPSIRGRILSAFLAFGLAIVVLVAFAMTVADQMTNVAFMLALVLFLAGLLSWHLASALTREVRVLARAVRDAEEAPPQPIPPSSFIPETSEIQELALSLQEYAWRTRTLTAAALDDAQACRARASENTSILSEFMYYIAHVLRTPVNAIRWTVESLKNEETGTVTEAQRELLDKLEYSTVKLASVADELQDAFIVLRGDALHLRPAPCDITRVIDEVVGTWAVPLRRKNLKVVWRHPSKALPQLNADEHRIAQVLNILIDNAIKYSSQGSTISIRVQAIDKNPPSEVAKQCAVPPGTGRCMVVAVSDQGIGIPRAEASSLFRPFFRGAKARELWVDGKGLGLTLARAIVSTHGGQIWFSSRPGKGTGVHFSIPLDGTDRVRPAEG